MSNLTENLRQWRADRNITKTDYLTFVGNILEELMEPIGYDKTDIEYAKDEILNKWFDFEIKYNLAFTNEAIDAIQDIQVFCINETELMGYDNIKCNKEVFEEINSREQDPIQKEQWEKFGTYGKWEKSLLPEHKEKWYKANYESCKL